MSIDETIREDLANARHSFNHNDPILAIAYLDSVRTIAENNGIDLPEEYDSLRRGVGELFVKLILDDVGYFLDEGNFDAAGANLSFVKYFSSENNVSLPKEYDSLRKRLSELYSES